MIRHVVAWRVAGESPQARAETAAEVASRLRSLVGVVPSVRALSAGAEAVYPGQNWDVALVADFDDVAGLEAYQTHPAHEEVAAFIGSVRTDRTAVDFEL